MKKNLLTIAGVCCLLLNAFVASAQGGEGYGSGIKINLDTTGTRFIRIINWHQVWVRFNENNPGSTANGEASNSQVDFAIRRSRFLFMTQISPKFLVVSHFGINNQTLLSGGAAGQGAAGTDAKKPQLFLHDLWAEYAIKKEVMYFGAGLNYWQGPSRKANASTLNFMTLDAPIHNWYNIDATDQFGRYPGMYIKGKILKSRKLDYRLALNFPFAMPTANALTKLDTTAAKNDKVIASYRGVGMQKTMTTGYLMYQFKDKESNVLPYTVGTYLGSKKVINVGFGGSYTPEMMWALQKNSSTGKLDTLRQDQLLLTADFFMDLPLNKSKGTAVTLYASAQYCDMGDNFVRLVGLSNPTNGLNSENTYSGTGNNVPVVGTGTIMYAEAGYLFPATKIGKFQPYVACNYAQYDRISDAVMINDVGVNYLVNGHHAKITLNYRSRPYFDYKDPAVKYGDIVKKGNKSEITMQFQVYL
ncbi:MAG TPA: hypothetical protein PLH61_08380 [Bacteroidia bacterium]|jgi:hypothetical protein|nr:hypothetical protein [Bacteroidia bacterium]